MTVVDCNEGMASQNVPKVLTGVNVRAVVRFAKLKEIFDDVVQATAFSFLTLPEFAFVSVFASDTFITSSFGFLVKLKVLNTRFFSFNSLVDVVITGVTAANALFTEMELDGANIEPKLIAVADGVLSLPNIDPTLLNTAGLVVTTLLYTVFNEFNIGATVTFLESEIVSVELLASEDTVIQFPTDGDKVPDMLLKCALPDSRELDIAALVKAESTEGLKLKRDVDAEFADDTDEVAVSVSLFGVANENGELHEVTFKSAVLFISIETEENATDVVTAIGVVVIAVAIIALVVAVSRGVVPADVLAGKDIVRNEVPALLKGTVNELKAVGNAVPLLFTFSRKLFVVFITSVVTTGVKFWFSNTDDVEGT